MRLEKICSLRSVHLHALVSLLRAWPAHAFARKDERHKRGEIIQRGRRIGSASPADRF